MARVRIGGANSGTHYSEARSMTREGRDPDGPARTRLWSRVLRLIGAGKLSPSPSGRQADGSCLTCGGYGLAIKCPQCGKRWPA